MFPYFALPCVDDVCAENEDIVERENGFTVEHDHDHATTLYVLCICMCIRFLQGIEPESNSTTTNYDPLRQNAFFAARNLRTYY